MANNPYGFVRADKLPLPNIDQRPLAQRVHDFYGANPGIGSDQAMGALPERRMMRLFQQLAPYYGSELDNDGLVDPGLEAAAANLGLDPNDQDTASALEQFAMEPQWNESESRINNFVYDSQQPYGFDFRFDYPDFTVYGRDTVNSDGEIISTGPGQSGELIPGSSSGEPIPGAWRRDRLPDDALRNPPAVVDEDDPSVRQLLSLLPMAAQMGGMATGHPFAGMAGGTALQALFSKLMG